MKVTDRSITHVHDLITLCMKVIGRPFCTHVGARITTGLLAVKESFAVFQQQMERGRLEREERLKKAIGAEKIEAAVHKFIGQR